MPNPIRGADVLVQTLKATGVRTLFALSGNQIMSVFDACLDVDLDLIHVRHEAAAVHMADAWGRLTGEPGVALVTAGPGFANCLSALYVAKMAEAPLILLSGSAPTRQLGSGAFQELSQAEMASYVTKASWAVADAGQLQQNLLRASALCQSGQPGPVHISLPVDVLEARLEQPAQRSPVAVPLAPERVSPGQARRVLDALAGTERPLIVAGPAASRGRTRFQLDLFSQAAGVPCVGMESPRGVRDPSLGRLADVLRQADLVVLFAKNYDFTLRLPGESVFDARCRFIALAADPSGVDSVRHAIVEDSQILISAVVEPLSSLDVLRQAAEQRTWLHTPWYDEVNSAVADRPRSWIDIDSGEHGALHPVELCGEIQRILDHDDAVFVSDGGEFGQWAQACLGAPHRVINGPSGAIGGSIPFAIAARLAFPHAPIVATLGDGTFGFHALEFDTAVRYQLPFIAVVGNDATWNAEFQLQLRDYGAERAIGCELLPSRYDRLVESLGGHGEHVTGKKDLVPALERAQGSGLPACVNVAIQRTAAPAIK